MDLKGKTAIVTGASRGIGPYIAKTLAENGMSIIAVARSAEGLQSTQA
ncbi:MAG: SDR family NAD(P)-dependent oxidoreductase, partial [Candidatus Marinimicrobia bacterium]|nr:SDR family NAD(P)-dependent oxidoreductase [Candidatus Neomarinimicrobiota bacterium]